MKLRCELHLHNELSRVILVARPEEKFDHLALKLAGFAMFHHLKPIVEPSAAHPSLSNIDVRPDIMALDEGGRIKLWLECGAVSINKIDKVARRMPETRVVVLKTSMHEAKQFRERLNDDVKQGARVQIWTWPEGSFNSWMNALQEKTELFGEASEKNFNLVVNNIAYDVDLLEV